MKSTVALVRNKYKELTKDGFLGGSEPLEELSDDFYELCKKSKGETKILAFVLSELFGGRARNENSRPVKTSESTKLYKAVNKPVLEALVALEKDKVKTETITAVIDAFLKE